RIAYGADEPGLNIGETVEGIDHRACGGIPRHRVHGEVAAGQVLFDRRAEGYLSGAPAVLVAQIFAERGHFDAAHGLVPCRLRWDHADGTETGADVVGAWKKPSHRLGPGVGGHVPIVGKAAEIY